jgi:hypothetical protein
MECGMVMGVSSFPLASDTRGTSAVQYACVSEFWSGCNRNRFVNVEIEMVQRSRYWEKDKKVRKGLLIWPDGHKEAYFVDKEGQLVKMRSS